MLISEAPAEWFPNPNVRFRYVPDSQIVFADPADLQHARFSLRLRPNNLHRGRPVHLCLHIGRIGAGQVLRLELVSAGLDCQVELADHVQGDWAVWLWKGARLQLGSGCTSLGTRMMICEGGSVQVGADGMFSENVFLQCGDGNHALVCLDTGRQLNGAPPSIELADHCWLGRNVTLVASGRCLKVGAGSVVGLGSVLARSLPAGVVAAGAPARVVRTGASWSRSSHADPDEIVRLQELVAGAADPVAVAPADRRASPQRWLAGRLRRVIGRRDPAAVARP